MRVSARVRSALCSQMRIWLEFPGRRCAGYQIHGTLAGPDRAEGFRDNCGTRLGCGTSCHYRTREFRVPALIGVENATDLLKNGMEITLDTHHRVIYEGRVQELIRYELVQSTVFEEAPEFRRLRTNPQTCGARST